MIFLLDFFTFVKFFLYSRDNAWIINEILHIFVSFSKKLLPCLQAGRFFITLPFPKHHFQSKEELVLRKGFGHIIIGTQFIPLEHIGIFILSR